MKKVLFLAMVLIACYVGLLGGNAGMDGVMIDLCEYVLLIVITLISADSVCYVSSKDTVLFKNFKKWLVK